MCMFSGDTDSPPLRSVKHTSIYAGEMAHAGWQGLVYEMSYDAQADLAMILPLPVPRGTLDDALEFVDLSSYAKVFSDMREGFVEWADEADELAGLATLDLDEAVTPLKVHDVGSFEASYVPSIHAFARLDERFRLPDDVWEHLPDYNDYGFAVFKLKQGNIQVHPMAFSFPRRDSRRLFFPTVHVHDGKVHESATFSHALYCQFRSASGVPSQGLGWEASHAPLLAKTWKELRAIPKTPWVAGQFVDCDRTGGLVWSDRLLYKARVHGEAPNADIWVTNEA